LNPEVAMPLPLAPLLPIALRLGALTAVGLAARSWVHQNSFPGRTDQRAEDALDGLGEGLSVHRPADRADTEASQTNATARVVRVIRLGNRTWELDAGMIARVRISPVGLRPRAE
jgi:hypothetical protein